MDLTNETMVNRKVELNKFTWYVAEMENINEEE